MVMTNARRNRRAVDLRRLMCSCGDTRELHMVWVRGRRRLGRCLRTKPAVCQCARFTGAALPGEKVGRD